MSGAEGHRDVRRQLLVKGEFARRGMARRCSAVGHPTWTAASFRFGSFGTCRRSASSRGLSCTVRRPPRASSKIHSNTGSVPDRESEFRISGNFLLCVRELEETQRRIRSGFADLPYGRQKGYPQRDGGQCSAGKIPTEILAGYAPSEKLDRAQSSLHAVPAGNAPGHCDQPGTTRAASAAGLLHPRRPHSAP
jgi:hypothetical protein